jgi:hypothetical protein
MYKLIKIKPTGMRVTLADSSDIGAMIAAGVTMQMSQPDLQLGVIDCEGIIIWPAA